jgi:hypothetical protein
MPIPRDLSQLEAEAARTLPPESLAYVQAGAGDRGTTRANAAAFERWGVRRRLARRPREVDLATTVLGTRMPAPVLLAPVGVQTLAHPDGELATAAVAAELGLTYVHSTQASYAMEEVAEANGDGARWFQLYWPTDDELTVSFLQRAQACGYTHLVITLDTTLLGWRPVDLDLGYSPFLENQGIANYTSDPVFRRKHMPVPAEVAPLPATGRSCRSSARTGTDRSCSRGSRAPATPPARLPRASTASWSPTTAAGRSTGPSPRSTPCRRSCGPSTGGSRCSSTPASAPAATRSSRWRWAPTR